MLSVSLTWKGLEDWASKDKPLQQALTKAVRSGGDKAARALRKDAVGYIRGRKNLKSAFIREGMRLQMPPRGATIEALRWNLWVSGNSVALSKYPHTRLKSGVKVRVNKGKGVLIRHAFEQKVKTGHIGIFVRKGKARFPIKELRSSTLRQVLEDEGAIDRLYAAAQDRMRHAFEARMSTEIEKLGR